jgi:hypothetical protein
MQREFALPKRFTDLILQPPQLLEIRVLGVSGGFI